MEIFFWQLNCALIFKLRTYAKLNSLKMELLTEMFSIQPFWHWTVCKQNLYLHLTELDKLELFESTE